MTQDLWSTERREAWRHFRATSAQMIDRLDDALQREHDLALIDYAILETLAEADGSRLRMSDLADLVLVSRSRLTYRVDRLVEVDFVIREECEDDRRGTWAIVTPAGRRAWAEARISHESAIDAWFFDHLTRDELRTCSAIMGRVAEKLSTDRPGH